MAGYFSTNIYNAFLLLSIHVPFLKNDILGNKYFSSFGIIKPIYFTILTIANEHTWFTLRIQHFLVLFWYKSICQATKNSKVLDSWLLVIPSFKRSLAFNSTSGAPIQNIVGCPHYFSPIHVMQLFRF